MMNSLQVIATRLLLRTTLLLVVTILFSSLPGSAQETPFVPSREMASQLFTEGNYSDALKHYSDLRVKFPADPLYKYYSGVCLVYLESDPESSSKLLEEADKRSSNLRPVPSDVYFFLARAYHQAGRFGEAINYYDRFIEVARRKEVKDLMVESYKEQCTSRSGSLVEIIDDIEEIVDDIPDVIPGDPVEEPDMNRESIKIDEEVIAENHYDTLNMVYDKLVGEALTLQFRSDSVNRLSERYRSKLSDLSGGEKESVTHKILSLEKMGFDYQTEADQKFIMASGLLGTKTDSEMAIEIIQPVGTISKELVLSKSEEADFYGGQQVSDSTVKVLPVTDTSIVAMEVKPLLVLFDERNNNILDIPVNSEMPEGLLYKIQTAAFRGPVKPEYFKSLGPVYGFKAADSDITFYFIGLFRAKTDADRAVVKVRNQGFRDAFVVAVLDGNRISLERAAVLESEWKEVSLAGGEINSTLKEFLPLQPEEPPTLVYRVELKRVVKPLIPEEVDGFRRLAGSREFSTITTSDKEIVYLIGKFITFESASTFSDLLYRNGVKEAKVVAYLGNREIPIEKARELFELYFNKQ